MSVGDDVHALGKPTILGSTHDELFANGTASDAFLFVGRLECPTTTVTATCLIRAFTRYPFKWPNSPSDLLEVINVEHDAGHLRLTGRIAPLHSL